MTSNTTSESHAHMMQTGWKSDGIAEKYARAETATRPYAEIFLSKAKLTEPNREINALDIGCGTGAVIAALYDTVPKERWDNVKVLAGDISEDMLAYVRDRATKNGWPGVTTKVVNGADGLEPEQFTHVFANAILFFLPNTALKNIHTSLKSGGFVGMTTWAAYPWYTWVEQAVARLPNPPTLVPYATLKAALQQGNAWDEPAFVKQQLEEAGFTNVEIVYEKVRARGGTVEQFMDVMIMPMNMVASFWEEDKRKDIMAEVMREMKKVVQEASEEGAVTMDMEGLVGVGWKA